MGKKDDSLRWRLTHREICRQNNVDRRERCRAYRTEYLSTHPCVDCGEADLVVLEFDHRGDKHEEICVLVSRGSFDRLVEEIKKCDVRCANCHRRRHARDGYAQPKTESQDWLTLPGLILEG